MRHGLRRTAHVGPAVAPMALWRGKQDGRAFDFMKSAGTLNDSGFLENYELGHMLTAGFRESRYFL